ncbi:agrin-like isoform X2 [Liolophura sinensis]|uniref:agrin-like isoform X2 n=1 Tax=Liolophura sinensis TaxID=3198878 RepID=UPI003158DC22
MASFRNRPVFMARGWDVSRGWCFVFLIVLSLSQKTVAFRRKVAENCNENTLESREDLANVILSGTVKKLYPNGHPGMMKGDIEVKRIFKGFNVINELTNDYKNSLSNARNYRELTVDRNQNRAANAIKDGAPKRGSHLMLTVDGFGDPELCDTKVNKFDTRIFLLTKGNNGELKLNSSVVRVTLRNLEHADAVVKGVPFNPPTPLPAGPCDRYYCAFGAICMTNTTTNAPYCQCIEKCHHVFSPVCGSDGVTYSSECHMRKASCIGQKRIQARFPGACDVKDPCEGRVCSFGARCVPSLDLTAARCECPARCDSYGDSVGSNPVCGNDGVDYPNMCEMRRAACRQMKDIRVKYYGKCDPCEGYECPVAQVCQLDEKRKPVCRCNDLCHFDFSPVCASNGRTYSNDCLMRVEACKTRKEIHVVFRGDCNKENNPCSRLQCSMGEECNIDRQGRATCVCPQPCEPVLRPVCGTDQVTYDNECELRRQSCVQRKAVSIDFSGPCGMDGPCRGTVCDHGATCVVKRGLPVCECPTCSEEFKPVCGTDGISYTNECKLRIENCERKTYVEVRQQGLCNGCSQVKCDFYSVCESDGKQARCVCPSQCVQVESKVCGTDGVTYQNECELKVAACTKKQLITIVSVGECDLCNKVKCKFGAKCENGLCVCPMTCPSTYDPVCASDEQTYKNECEMRMVACSQSIELDAIFNRECDTYEMSGSGSGDEVCDETTCNFGGTCALTADNEHGCTCNFNCEAVREVVCGSDGSTYGNECLMREESCRRQEEISKQALENCDIEEEACDGKEPLINPITSQEYDCDFQHDVCPAHSYCHKGQSFAKCCPEDQTKSCWDTPYGCCPDGKTVSPGAYHAGCPSYCQCNPLGSFSTTCDSKSRQCTCKPGVGGLRCDRCEPGYWGLPRINEGNIGCIPCGCNIHGSVRDDCEQMTGRCMCKPGYTGMKCNICPNGSLLGPFGCDNNGRDTPVKCWELSCQFGSVCEETEGVAQCICKGTCPFNERPSLVCGTNGQTYGSECQLKLFACRLKQDIKVAYSGPCSGTTTSAVTTLAPPTTKLRNTKFVARLTNEDYGRFLTKPTVRSPGRPREVRRPSTASPPPTDGDICDINPCQNGGTCTPDKSLGFSCLCPLGKGGAICKEEIAFGVPSFSGQSYLVLPGFPQVSRELTIELEFRSLNKDGILLYTGQHLSGGRDFVALAVIDGYVEFRFDLGSGPVTLRSRNPIELNKFTRVVARRYQRDGLLVIGDEKGVQKSSPGDMKSLDLEENLYLGNVPNQDKDIIDRIGVNVGLVGCIEFIRAGRKENMREYKLSYPTEPNDILDGGQISDCGDSPCSSLPCQNGGTCIVLDNASHKCLCTKEFQGDQCEKPSSPCLNNPCQGGGVCFATPDGDFDCTCPADREGRFCEKVTMKSASVPEFDGNSYMELPLTDYVGRQLSIEVWFKALKPDGVILFATQYSGGSGDYISLNLINRTLEFTFDIGSGPAVIKSAKPIELNTWTSVVAQRLNKNGDMIVDGGKPVTGKAKGSMNELNLGESMFVGGYPSILDLPHAAEIVSRFTGAIQRIYINGRLIDDLPSEALTKHNVKEYEGPPCNVNPCMNGGVCVPQLSSYTCRCPIEYVGMRCQISAVSMNEDRPVSFDRTTFLQYENKLTESLRGQQDNKFSLKFKTKRKNGLLLFSNQGDSLRGDYLALAIVNGKVEFSYNLGKQSEDDMFVIRSDVSVNNNKWHTVTIQREKRVGTLTVDDENPISGISLEGASQLDTDGVLWIGGRADLPQGLPKEYGDGFRGCIKDIVIDNQSLHLVNDRTFGVGRISFCAN